MIDDQLKIVVVYIVLIFIKIIMHCILQNVNCKKVNANVVELWPYLIAILISNSLQSYSTLFYYEYR